MTLKTNLSVQVALVLVALPAFAANPTYLALGDSIAFGMNPLLLAGPSLPTANQFVGYPEAFANISNLPASKLINGSCPGETSGSFLHVDQLDLGCNSAHQNPYVPPFKALQLLHVNYPITTSQMDFAMAQIAANPKLNLITLTIGANDVLMHLTELQACGTNQACGQDVLGPVLAQYGQNLATILTNIRSKYKGTLMLTKYYSPDPTLDGVTLALNATMVDVATQLAQQPRFAPVQFADTFVAFKIAAFDKGGDACQAGLLIQFPPAPGLPPCDQHPSEKGRNVIAYTVLLTQQLAH